MKKIVTCRNMLVVEFTTSHMLSFNNAWLAARYVSSAHQSCFHAMFTRSNSNV